MTYRRHSRDTLRGICGFATSKAGRCGVTECADVGDADYQCVPKTLNRSSASTIRVMITYLPSRSRAKAWAENATRTIGVAIRSSKPTCIMPRP